MAARVLFLQSAHNKHPKALFEKNKQGKKTTYKEGLNILKCSFAWVQSWDNGPLGDGDSKKNATCDSRFVIGKNKKKPMPKKYKKGKSKWRSFFRAKL